MFHETLRTLKEPGKLRCKEKNLAFATKHIDRLLAFVKPHTAVSDALTDDVHPPDKSQKAPRHNSAAQRLSLKVLLQGVLSDLCLGALLSELTNSAEVEQEEDARSQPFKPKENDTHSPGTTPPGPGQPDEAPPDLAPMILSWLKILCSWVTPEVPFLDRAHQAVYPDWVPVDEDHSEIRSHAWVSVRLAKQGAQLVHQCADPRSSTAFIRVEFYELQKVDAADDGSSIWKTFLPLKAFKRCASPPTHSASVFSCPRGTLSHVTAQQLPRWTLHVLYAGQDSSHSDSLKRKRALQKVCGETAFAHVPGRPGGTLGAGEDGLRMFRAFLQRQLARFGQVVVTHGEMEEGGGRALRLPRSQSRHHQRRG
ncbi:hypothetical protein BDZ88DRAFT_438835 [Geranomyces variabilis]|nr:hypothetical protein BDZ88DRAFT_438835 [Geranomyces variabilis]